VAKRWKAEKADAADQYRPGPMDKSGKSDRLTTAPVDHLIADVTIYVASAEDSLRADLCRARQQARSSSMPGAQRRCCWKSSLTPVGHLITNQKTDLNICSWRFSFSHSLPCALAESIAGHLLMAYLIVRRWHYDVFRHGQPTAAKPARSMAATSSGKEPCWEYPLTSALR